MKLWINFDEKDIKKRKNGWKEGDDWKTQLIFEEEQKKEYCNIEFGIETITIHFNNGFLEINKKEFGGLF